MKKLLQIAVHVARGTEAEGYTLNIYHLEHLIEATKIPGNVFFYTPHTTYIHTAKSGSLLV